MKKYKILFWVSTIIIFLWEGLIPAFTFQTEMAKEGIRSLGYPEYLGYMLTFFKVAGTLTLVIPQAPARMKEWAYAGLAIDFICASVSITVVMGLVPIVILPIFCLALLAISYLSYHKLHASNLTLVNSPTNE